MKKQTDPSPNATKDSEILLIPGDDETIQHIRPINKSGPQEIVALWKKEYEFKYAKNKSFVV